METTIKQSKIVFNLSDLDEFGTPFSTEVKVYKNSPESKTIIEFELDGVHHHLLRYELEKLLKVFPVYKETAPNLTLESDYTTSFYSGVYDGKKCVFVVWSAIEFIFTN